VAHHSPDRGTTEGNKKSKGKAKVSTAGATSAESENKANNEEETGKLDGTTKPSKENSSVTHKAEKVGVSNAEPVKQEFLDRSGGPWVTEPTPPRAPSAPPMTPKAQAPSQKMPAHEVNDPHTLTSNPFTHTPGSQVSQIDSNSVLTLLSLAAHNSITSQQGKSEDPVALMGIPSKLTLRSDMLSSKYVSRRSSNSTSTLVGTEDREPPVAHPVIAPNSLDPSHLASISAEASQPDVAPTAAPKKKKKKSKKNKKTTAIATEPTQPTESGDASESIGAGENNHSYDPSTSQLSHIDAIRRAVKYDTSSYFARMNARIDKEAEERKEAGLPPKARKFWPTCKVNVANT
jgi:hypothetical protein